jgi:predicted nucleic acid-binding protein
LGEPETLRERFLPDANLFVAAIRGSGVQTDSARLLLWLIQEDSIGLVGDSLLLEEFVRYGKAFRSPESESLLSALLGKVQWLEPDLSHQLACVEFISTPDPADVAHAAICLKTGAVLISNDHHFDAIAKAGVIRRLTLSQAIKRLL